MVIEAIFKRLKKKMDLILLNALLYIDIFDEKMVENIDYVTQWSEKLKDKINESIESTNKLKDFDIKVLKEDGSDCPDLCIIQAKNGFTIEKKISCEFFMSNDYIAMSVFSKKINDLFNDKSYVKRGDKILMVNNFKSLLTFIFDEGKKGRDISRYKGLGEMNPDQLWDTTMDANARILLQVRIEDVIAADEIFTTLMGDNVEPRRDFIESNALLAENIDI